MKNRTPSICISLVNWMNYNQTKRSIHDLLALRYEGELHIYIMDNDSPNDSFNYLKREFEDLVMINRSNENLGFAGGHLQNYMTQKKTFDAELFWILNSDIKLNSDTLTQLIEAYNDNPNALYGSISVNKDNTVRFAGSPLSSDPTFSENDYNSFNGIVYEDLLKKHDCPYEVFSLEGSSMIIPSEIIDSYGFMSTDFFMYGEETDYCFRLRELGIPTFAVPSSTIIHSGEGSVVNDQLKLIIGYYKRRNLIRFYKKHYNFKIGSFIRSKTHLFNIFRGYLSGVIGRKNDLYYWSKATIHGLRGVRGRTFNPNDYVE